MPVNTCEVCGKTVPHNNKSGRVSKWDVMKAQTAGWFFKKNGETWCPEHLPDWVESWRKKQEEEK